MTLRERFIKAVKAGELGQVTDYGTIVTVPEFKAYFSDINEGYAETFLPSVVIEAGQYTATHTRFVFRVRAGVYRLHPQVLLSGRSGGVEERQGMLFPGVSGL